MTDPLFALSLSLCVVRALLCFALQRKLVCYHWALSLTSNLIDYLGSAMNYLVLAIAIFARTPAIWNVPTEDLPKEISNASFVIFQLIFAFSQLSDTAKEVSSLLGYVERVGELVRELDRHRGGARSKDGDGGGDNLSALGPSSAEDEDVDKAAAEAFSPLGFAGLTFQKKRGDRAGSCLVPPQQSELGSRPFEYSIHTVEGEVADVVRRVFPDLSSPAVGNQQQQQRRRQRQLVAVPTFQCAAKGVDLNPDSGSSGEDITAEMNRLHLSFVALEGELYRALTALGYFCDSVDPLTACAMHSRCGERYSEVVGARHLLGYKVKGQGRSGGGCPLTIHPQFGSGSYVATPSHSPPLSLSHPPHCTFVKRQ